MPESPVSGGFSAAPAAKKALSAAEMQAMVSGQLNTAAKVLGGAVVGQPAAPEESQPVKSAQEDANIAPEDKKVYIRSLLAKEPFSKTYQLFGGNLSVSFRTRKATENTKVSSIEDGVARHRARLLTSLLQILVGADKPVSLDDLDDVAYSAVFEAFNKFEELCDVLFRRANDPDFWTGTAGRI